MDWHDLDASALFEAIRGQAPPPDAERMVWALERILRGARIEPGLLDHLAVASICALAYRDRETPRAVLEHLFRRSIDDDTWRRDYASLLSTPT
jgi:hypothetical protein